MIAAEALSISQMIGSAIATAIVVVPGAATLWFKYGKQWVKATLHPALQRTQTTDDAVNHGRMDRMDERLHLVDERTLATDQRIMRISDQMLRHSESFREETTEIKSQVAAVLAALDNEEAA